MDCLDQAVFGEGDWLEAFTQVAQALAMQRVHTDLVAAQGVAQPAARLDLHAMHLSVLHLDRVFGVFPVVVEAGLGVHLLVDVATQGYVDFLHATADAEDRQATLDRRLDQRDVEQVACLVLAFAWGFVFLAIQGRIDVAAGTGQVDAVGHVQIGLEVFGATAGGYQDRDAIGEFDQRSDVFVGHDLIVMAFALLAAHGHQDDGFAQGRLLVANVAVGHMSPWDRFDLSLLCRRTAGALSTT
ncbi:hypothetical protein D3C81_1264880 [compost metagenome]